MTSSGGSRVAVVLVDCDDRLLAPATVDAVLSNLLSPADAEPEVVVGDARTGVGRSWAASPRVRAIAGSGNSLSTALRMRALAMTSAPLVAFLDARAVPPTDWLDRSVRALDDDPSVAAVTVALPSHGEPTASFTGNVGAHHPVDSRRLHEVLYPLPEAMVVRRDGLLGRGGVDESLTWPVAAVELGLRLALAGSRVLLEPRVRIEGECICRADSYSGLAALYCCFGDDNLAAALPAALLVAAHRQPDGYGIDRFLAASPYLRDRRQRIQSARASADQSVFARFITALEPARGDEALPGAYAEAAGRHALHSLFPIRRRILVVTPDILAERLAGPAIRAWHIAEALAAEHHVHLVSTASRCDISADSFEVSSPPEAELAELAAWADIIVVQGFAMEGRPYFRDGGKVVVADLYDPIHLEQLELFRDEPAAFRQTTARDATRVLNEQLVRGDFFMCASVKQRAFWLGQLAAVGRINPLTYDADERLDNLLAVVPFGVPDAAPVPTAPALKGVVPGIERDDEVILWGGGVYNWFDPVTLIHAIDSLRRRRPRVRLYFMGLRHPNPEVAEMRAAMDARRVARDLGLTGVHVFFNEGWVPYEDRQNFLLEADIGVSTHLDHLETEFSFRTRILDYIWAALPIVATDGDWFAELILTRGLGLVVPSGDATGLAVALERILADHEFAASSRQALAAMRAEFAWDRVLAPLVAFCRAPARAPDLVDQAMSASQWITSHPALSPPGQRETLLASRRRPSAENRLT